MTHEQIRTLIEVDPDFIYSKRYNNSVSELLKKYPEGCPDRIIAAVLMIKEEEVEVQYQKIVVKLRERMQVR